VCGRKLPFVVRDFAPAHKATHHVRHRCRRRSRPTDCKQREYIQRSLNLVNFAGHRPLEFPLSPVKPNRTEPSHARCNQHTIYGSITTTSSPLTPPQHNITPTQHRHAHTHDRTRSLDHRFLGQRPNFDQTYCCHLHTQKKHGPSDDVCKENAAQQQRQIDGLMDSIVDG
jgi:hypothetical protein